MLKRGILLVSVLVLLILLTSSLNTVSASYQADIIIDVHNDGIVEIKGDSNHPVLKSGIYDDLTTKDHGYWILDMSTNEIFSEYNYKINLPKNTKITYLGVYSVNTFEDKNGFEITGNVKNRPFKVIIQYKQELIKSNYLFLIIFIVLICLGVLGGYYFLKKKKIGKKYSRTQFSEREFLIINLLKKNKGCLTQAQLEKMTSLPKASLHRNIASLELKGIIEKNKAGMSNKINLKE